MFKKLLIITTAISASFFIYAEQKKVTANMLIGKWECNAELTHQYYDKDGTLNNEKNDPNGPYIVTYKKNDQSMTIQYGDVAPTEFDFERFTKNPYLKEDQTREAQRSDEYIFISNDKYKNVRKWRVRDQQSKKLEEIHLYEQLCDRLSD